jgi:molybdopterin synthase catalytic subunit
VIVIGEMCGVLVEVIDDQVGTRMAARLPIHAAVTTEPLDVDRHRLLVGGDAAGALVTFVGQVRNHDDGRPVRLLEYSAHPVAATVLRGIATVAAAAEGVRGIAVSHRVGELGVGDVALCCVVAADHRRQAFDACGELVEEVKRLLPVWKRQRFADGDEEWVGSA